MSRSRHSRFPPSRGGAARHRAASIRHGSAPTPRRSQPTPHLVLHKRTAGAMQRTWSHVTDGLRAGPRAARCLGIRPRTCLPPSQRRCTTAASRAPTAPQARKQRSFAALPVAAAAAGSGAPPAEGGAAAQGSAERGLVPLSPGAGLSDPTRAAAAAQIIKGLGIKPSPGALRRLAKYVSCKRARRAGVQGPRWLSRVPMSSLVWRDSIAVPSTPAGWHPWTTAQQAGAYLPRHYSCAPLPNAAPHAHQDEAALADNVAQVAQVYANEPEMLKTLLERDTSVSPQLP